MEWYHPHLVWIFSPQPNLEFLPGKAEVCSYSNSIQISCHKLFHWFRPRPSSLCHVKYPPFFTQFSCHCAGLVQMTVQRPNSPQPACCEGGRGLARAASLVSCGEAQSSVISWPRHTAAATALPVCSQVRSSSASCVPFAQYPMSHLGQAVFLLTQ